MILRIEDGRCMKRERGFTVVELVVSFVLISIIVIGMLMIALRYRNNAQISTEKLEMERYRDTLTKAIQEDIVEYGVDSIDYCEVGNRNCVVISFDDGTTKRLEISNVNVLDRYIRYDGRKFLIEEYFPIKPTSLGDASITLPYSGIELLREEFTGNTIYQINIPIFHVDLEGDFGIHIVALKEISSNQSISTGS